MTSIPHSLEQAFVSTIRGPRARLHFPDRIVDLGESSSPVVFEARVKCRGFWDRLLARGNLGLGECFMDEGFVPEKGELHEFLTLLLRNKLNVKLAKSPRLVLLGAWLRLRDTLRGKAGNIAAHYDIGDDLYQAFLDESLAYSCGYAVSHGDSLAAMQRQKFERICRKLELAPGESLLDIGSGFGGLLLHAVSQHGAKGHGITNSSAHARLAMKRAANEGIALNVVHGDYGGIQGCYDKVVSVGMLEHVPRGEYGKYFRTVARSLSDAGLGLVHFIGCNSRENLHDPFIQRYIFPGSNQPRLSEVCEGLEKNGLYILDVENMVRQYRLTALRWLENFRAQQGRLDTEKYDARFRRMWEYYLHCGVAAATASESALYQVLFAKDRGRPMPLARV